MLHKEKTSGHNLFTITVLLLVVLLLPLAAGCTDTTSNNSKNSQNRKDTTAHQGSVGGFSDRPVSQTTPVVYTGLGASDAAGVGTNDAKTEDYIPLIGNHLAKGSHVIDLGISGIHLHEALEKEVPVVYSSAPQLVTIWLVANDFVAGVSYDDYKNDLQTLLKGLTTRTQAEIVMANLPDLTLLPAFAQRTDEQKQQMRVDIQHWNQQIADMARGYHVKLVDLFSQNSQLTAHPEYVSGDGFHPSAKGYEQLAGFFWQAMIQ